MSTAHFNDQDDNLETYSIFWLDTAVDHHENRVAQKKLRKIINRLRTFVDPDDFMAQICRICQGDRTILIVSGQMGRIVVPEMQKMPQVNSVYVYCCDIVEHTKWSRLYSKVCFIL